MSKVISMYLVVLPIILNDFFFQPFVIQYSQFTSFNYHPLLTLLVASNSHNTYNQQPNMEPVVHNKISVHKQVARKTLVQQQSRLRDETKSQDPFGFLAASPSSTSTLTTKTTAKRVSFGEGFTFSSESEESEEEETKIESISVNVKNRVSFGEGLDFTNESENEEEEVVEIFEVEAIISDSAIFERDSAVQPDDDWVDVWDERVRLDMSSWDRAI